MTTTIRGLLPLALLVALAFVRLRTGWSETAIAWVFGHVQDLIAGWVEQQGG